MSFYQISLTTNRLALDSPLKWLPSHTAAHFAAGLKRHHRRRRRRRHRRRCHRRGRPSASLPPRVIQQTTKMDVALLEQHVVDEYLRDIVQPPMYRPATSPGTPPRSTRGRCRDQEDFGEEVAWFAPYQGARPEPRPLDLAPTHCLETGEWDLQRRDNETLAVRRMSRGRVVWGCA